MERDGKATSYCAGHVTSRLVAISSLNSPPPHQPVTTGMISFWSHNYYSPEKDKKHNCPTCVW